MDFHLHTNGQTVGVFSLEELHRRRLRGELSAADLVWREGMDNWAPLDSVLAANGLPVPVTVTTPMPPPLPASAAGPPRTRPMVWAWIFAAVFVLVIVGAIGFTVIYFAPRNRQARQDEEVASSSDDSVGIASKRVVAGTNTLTDADVRKRGREFRERQYLNAYKKYGSHKQAWDHDATQLFESWIAAHYGGPTNLPDPQALANKLAATPGCDDPLVLLAASANAGDIHEKIARLQRALDGFDKSPYKAYPKFYAAVDLATDSPNLRPALDQSSLRYFTEMLSDGSILPSDEPELAEILMNGWGRAFRQRHPLPMISTTRAAKNFKWLSLVLEGEHHVAQAWKARGGGYVDTVNTQGWQGFETHSAQAHKAFEEAWTLHPDRVIPPARLIYVTMGEAGPEEMRKWFDRAIAAQIDYPEAWSSMRWGLRPRWHGSLEAMLALGVTAVQTKRFDTDVPRKLFDVLADLEQELKIPAGQHIYGREDIWPHLKQMYEGYIAEPVQATNVSGWHGAYSTVAFLAGHYDLSREQLQIVNWKMMPAMTGWGTDLSLMPLLVAGLTGLASNDVSRAEKSYHRRGGLDEAATLFTALAASDKADDRTRQYAQARLASIKREQFLAKGEWIDLLPANDHDPDWAIWEDKIQRLPDGAVEVAAGPQGHGFYSRTRIGENFEVKGEIELVKSSTKAFQAGIMMGLPDNMNSHWFAFRLYRNSVDGSGVVYSSRWGTPRLGENVAVNDHNVFQFKYADGKADAWVNGNQVLDKAVVSKTISPLTSDCLVGLGAANDGNETVIRYRDVKIRRLDPSGH
jgi:hypothetical protein